MTATREPAPILPVILLLFWAAISMTLWAMAFYHAPAATPEWLLRAQSACFGTSETGLPDTYGWMVLVLGPVSLLAGLLVALGGELRQGSEALIASASGKMLLGVVLATLLAEGVWVSGRIDAGVRVAATEYRFETIDELPLDYPRMHLDVAPFLLTDQHDAQVSPVALGDKVVLLTFAFAHCKTVCPVILENVLQAAGNFPPEKVEVLVVTLDPWRDTPSSLPALASHWRLGENAHVLSGSVDDVVAVLDGHKVPRQRDGKTGDVTHPALVYVLDTTGVIAYGFNNPSVKWLSTAVERLLEPSDLAVDISR
jgi:cytochrome oxidase Cu insertion factor (SCO1/SenC/PrrC family)